MDQVRAQAGNQVWGQTMNQVQRQIWNQVWDLIKNQISQIYRFNVDKSVEQDV